MGLLARLLKCVPLVCLVAYHSRTLIQTFRVPVWFCCVYVCLDAVCLCLHTFRGLVCITFLSFSAYLSCRSILVIMWTSGLPSFACLLTFRALSCVPAVCPATFLVCLVCFVFVYLLDYLFVGLVCSPSVYLLAYLCCLILLAFRVLCCVPFVRTFACLSISVLGLPVSCIISLLKTPSVHRQSQS